MRVLILTEGGKGIGFGHITRMLSLYQAFEEKGAEPYIVIKGDSSVKPLIQGTNWKILDWIKNIGEVKERFGKIDILLIDSYLAPKEAYEYLSKIAKVPAYYDDFRRMDYPCGVVINGNIHAELIKYVEDPCMEYLLGVKYLPIRKEFWKIEGKIIKDKIENILITFGGEDSRNLTSLVLKLLVENYKNCKKVVVIGRSFSKENLKEIKLAADDKTEFVYYPTAEGMKRLMLKADVAISAAGQTLYELACVGVPTIAVIVAENQILQAKVFKEKEFLLDLFYWKDEDIYSRMVESIHKSEPFKIRYEKYKIGRSLIDGKGALRLANKLASLVE